MLLVAIDGLYFWLTGWAYIIASAASVHTVALQWFESTLAGRKRSISNRQEGSLVGPLEQRLHPPTPRRVISIPASTDSRPSSSPPHLAIRCLAHLQHLVDPSRPLLGLRLGSQIIGVKLHCLLGYRTV